MILVYVERVEVCGGLALDEGSGRVVMRAVVVYDDLTCVKVGLTEYGRVVLKPLCSRALKDDLVAELNLCELIIGEDYCDDACLVDKVEAILVHKRRTYDALDGNRLADLCIDSVDHGDGIDSLFGEADCVFCKNAF